MTIRFIPRGQAAGRSGYSSGVLRNQPFLEITEDIEFEPLPTVLIDNTGNFS